MVNALLGTLPRIIFVIDGIILRSGRSLRKDTCDVKGSTVVVIKPAQSNDLIGGYNPIGWRDDGGYQSTMDSFLFKLTTLGSARYLA